MYGRLLFLMLILSRCQSTHTMQGVRKVIKDTIELPFMYAVRDNYPTIVRNYIRLGYDVNSQHGQALRIAVASRQPDMIRLLLQLGANIDIQGPELNNRTPLMHAAELGIPDIVRVLLEAGANIDAVTREGLTVWDYAQPFPHDTEAVKQNKGVIRRLIVERKVGPILGKQAHEFQKNTSRAALASTALEDHLIEAGQSEAVGQLPDLSRIINPYLLREYTLPSNPSPE